MIWGKIIAALIGFKLGGPLGALVGLIIGHWIDRALSGKGSAERKRARAGRLEQQRLFTVAVVSLAAKLAKVDGVVAREEVDAFKAQFHIPPSQAAAIGKLYDEAKRDPSDYESHARVLADMFQQAPLLLVGILQALNNIAIADGRLHPAEKEFLDRVAQIFGLSPQAFSEERTATPPETDPYAVLGVARDAPMAEIKAAWRRLTREHHPDTLMAKGMPQDMIDMATKTMASINAAYDRIRAERGEN